MKMYGLSAQIEKRIEKNKLYIPLIEAISTGVLLCERKDMKVIYANSMAKNILHIEEGKELIFLQEHLHDGTNILLEEGEISESIFGRAIDIKAIILDEYIWVTLIDSTNVVKMEDTTNKVMELNKEYQALFGEYGDENIMITNKNGEIIFAGESISKTCGVDKDYFTGKTVFEIEREKIFYPSVTVRVLQEKKSQVLLQKTQNNDSLVTLGTPLFGVDGEIEKVVSVTKDFSTQLKISSMMAKLNKSELIENDTENAVLKSLVTCDEKMLQVKNLIKLVAPTKSTILISGATGTGKEVVAQCLYKLSNRKDQPFVAVNCGTISPSIVESELFGYAAGSFTGASREGKEGLIEAANGGTLFLDEISELPLEQQVKLLHVLQEQTLIKVGSTKTVHLDVRIIAATNKNLEKLVEEGLFREDLYYRLNVVPIAIPPLSNRKADIALLVKYFLDQYNKKYKKNKRLSVDVINFLRNYDWPGNVRELENTIERLVVTASYDLIDMEILPDKIKKESSYIKDTIKVEKIMKLNEAVEETEKKIITMALDKYKTITKAAEILGIDQSTLSRKISRYKIKIKQ